MKMIPRSKESKIVWDLCNDILNIVRDLKGLPLRPKKENPFYVKEGGSNAKQ